MFLAIQLALQTVIISFESFVLTWFSIRRGAVKQVGRYSDEVQRKAISLGLTTEKEIRHNYIKYKVIEAVLNLITIFLFIMVWNKVYVFESAFLEALLYLEVLNIFECVVINILWISWGANWVIPGTEDYTDIYIKPADQVRKRVINVFVYIAEALAIGGIVQLISDNILFPTAK